VQCTRQVACAGTVRNAFGIISGNPERTRSLNIPMHIWDFGIKFNLRKLVHGSVDWFCLVEDKVQWPVVMKT